MPSAPSSQRSPVSSAPALRPDRRAHRRAPLDRPVLVETHERTITARAVDVSAGGVALRTDAALAVGTRATVYFELPMGVGVETSAVLVRRDGEVAVFSFVDGPQEAMVALRAYCRVSGLMPAVR